MTPNPRRQDRQLQELYDQLPHIECRGFCHDSCGPIQSSVRERTRIETAAGKKITCGFGPTCSMLTPGRRCGVYELRPMICRLWGLTRSMPCPYGCKPERVVEDDEGLLLLVKADEIGGVSSDRERDIIRQVELQVRTLGDVEVRLRLREFARETFERPTLQGRDAAAKSLFERS